MTLEQRVAVLEEIFAKLQDYYTSAYSGEEIDARLASAGVPIGITKEYKSVTEMNQDFIKLNGRFVSPHSLISLPENIAFQLLGAAMEKNKDEVVLADWEVALGDLTDRTQASRKLVKSVARITDTILSETDFTMDQITVIEVKE